MSEYENLKKIAEQFVNGELPILEDESEFTVGCEQCGECCRDRGDILLSPHDVFYLVKATKMPIDEMLKKYTEIYLGDSSRLPIVRIVYRFDALRANQIMNAMPSILSGATKMPPEEMLKPPTICPFLGRKENKYYCRVHEHKPSVCRIYPLGRTTGCSAVEFTEKRDMSPKYFAQPLSEPLCLGMRNAVKNNFKSTVVDWVGGKEKKSFADRYWVLFNEFTQKIGQTINLNEVYKLENEDLKNACFNMMFNLMYVKYDFETDDEGFLEQYKKNTEQIIECLQVLAMHPNGKLQPKIAKRNRDKSA